MNVPGEHRMCIDSSSAVCSTKVDDYHVHKIVVCKALELVFS